MVIPEPPPSAIKEGRDGRGVRLAISSRASSRGGSRRAPGARAARARAVSVMSSTNAATRGAHDPAATAEASR
ncbi:hypothetical protein ASD18_12305 [Cellulomonas sp. Root137]|nr:hypothetical protein ASD18_12305 [Cellulomonas sp. Root137]